VSYGSGPRLSTEVSSGAATCPVAPCGPWDSSIKKSLSVLPVQLGTHVPNARAQVFNVSDMAYMTSEQAAQSMAESRAHAAIV
jgi:hypothetical protein